MKTEPIRKCSSCKRTTRHVFVALMPDGKHGRFICQGCGRTKLLTVTEMDRG